MPGFQPNLIKDAKASKRTKIRKDSAKQDKKSKNNFYKVKNDISETPSSIELQEILSQGGVSDINIK
jgi:hypothetical protein